MSRHEQTAVETLPADAQDAMYAADHLLDAIQYGDQESLLKTYSPIQYKIFVELCDSRDGEVLYFAYSLLLEMVLRIPVEVAGPLVHTVARTVQAKLEATMTKVQMEHAA